MSVKNSGFALKWPVIIVTGLVVIGAGVWFYKSRGADKPAYQTTTVDRGSVVQTVTATGTLNPVNEVQVGCQVSGRIRALYVDFNSVVKSNQLIAEIDPRTYEAQVAQATADLANAQANMELQAANAERATQLYSNKLISVADYDTAVATLHEAEATLQIKQASLTNAVNNLGYCKIYSPVNGIVISRSVDVGQTVSASLSAPTLFDIANDLSKMQIDAAVDEADIGGVREGQEVDFTVDAYPNRTFHGKVTQVRNAPTAVNNVVTYDTVISVDNADLELKPGMTANVSIVIAERDDALKIPNSALRFRPPDTAVVEETASPTNEVASADSSNAQGERPGGRRGRGGGMRGHNGEPSMFRTVYVLPADAPAVADGDTPLRTVKVHLGISDGFSTEIVSGLKEGDRVVTGLAFPASQASGTDNPFGGFRRRF